MDSDTDTGRFSFHRQDLARTLCDSLEGKGLADARSGLFLAAPRRTGKSTFLREDLVPEVERRGWIAIYVDLWADRARDPGLMIADAIKARLAEFDGPIAKLAKSAGMEKISVLRTFTFDLGKTGLPPGITLTDALDTLYKAAQRSIVLIVDEAQHALATETGTNAMFALKAARDQMNQGVESPRLFLVFTGSNRDKLANLLLNRTQPFFGSRVTNFRCSGGPSCRPMRRGSTSISRPTTSSRKTTCSPPSSWSDTGPRCSRPSSARSRWSWARRPAWASCSRAARKAGATASGARSRANTAR